MEPVTGISGTYAAAIMGINPWKSPLEAYLAIFGLDDTQENEAMRWGSRLEPLLAREYHEQTGAFLWPSITKGLDRKHPLRHAKHEWWVGTPDRLIITDPNFLVPDGISEEAQQNYIEECINSKRFWSQVVRGWEAKTSGVRMAQFWGEPGTDQVPEPYLIQASWYLSLVRSYNPDVTHWDIVVLIGGQEYRQYQIQHNQKLEDAMTEKAWSFWRNHIMTNTPPPPNADPAWSRYFKNFLPEDEQPLGNATIEEEQKYFELFEIKKQIDQLQERYDTLVNELKLLIGKRSGICGHNWRITWKKSKDVIKTDWSKVIHDMLQIAPDMEGTIQNLIEKHSKKVQGQRRFVPIWPA